MLHADDIAQLRARLSAAQQTLAALLAQEAPGDAAQARQIAEARDQIAALTAALQARGVVVDDREELASAAAQRTTMTGGSYAEGDLGVFIGGGAQRKY